MPDLHVYLFMVMEKLMLSGFVKATSAARRDAREALLASMPTRAASPPSSRIASRVSDPAPSLWHSSTMLTDAAYAMERASIFLPFYLSMCPNVVDGLGNIVCYDRGPSTACCRETCRKSDSSCCIRVDFYSESINLGTLFEKQTICSTYQIVHELRFYHDYFSLIWNISINRVLLNVNTFVSRLS